jgi:hypothetical protein
LVFAVTNTAVFHTFAKTHLNAKIFSIFLYKIDRRLYNLGTALSDKTYTQKNRYSDGLYGIAKINQQLFCNSYQVARGQQEGSQDIR